MTALFRAYYQSAGSPAGGVGQSFADAVLDLSPTAYWRLGEPSGTTATDEMGVQNGTYVNTPTLGVSGYTGDGDTAATFALASSEYVLISDNAAWDIGTSDWSVGFAIKRSSWPGATNEVIVSRGNGFGTGEWRVQTYPFSDTSFELVIEGTAYVLTASGLADDAWHYCGISIDRSGFARLSVDGSFVSQVDVSAEVSTDLTASSAMSIAANADPADYFDGSVDEVIFWKSSLIADASWTTLHAARDGTGGGGGGSPTQADIYDAAVLALSPVAYYTMDEPTGSTMVDASTTGNDGTYVNAPTLGASGPFTGAGAVTFDGTDWATAPYDAALDLGTGDFSVVLWVKRSAESAHDEWMLQRGPDGADLLELATWYEDEDKFGMRFTNAGETEQIWTLSTGTPALDDNAWHMIAMCADRDGNVVYYVDNTADGSTSISSYVHELDGSYTLYVARRGVAGHEWSGTMSRLAIFDSLLSAGDIDDLWTAAGN